MAEAGTKQLERVKEALEPIRPSAVTKPKATDPMKVWLRTDKAQLTAPQRGSQV